MKIVEKISLTVFSAIILILSLSLCLVLFNWIEVSYFYYALNYVVSTPLATNISLGILGVLIILSTLCIFFPTSAKEKDGRAEGILLENETGKLMISIDTIENLVKGVVSGFPSVNTTNCKVRLDKQVNNVTIDLNLVVSSETIIKDLSFNLQNRIKEVIKTTTDIEVKEINIKIKNIETPKEPKVKEE